jgi:hypothetical protein
MAMDDLRAALTTSDADLFLLAAPGEFGSGAERAAAGVGSAAGAGGTMGGGADDWAVLDQRRAAGGAMISLEPMPASVLQLHTPTLGSGPDQPAVVLGPGESVSASAGGSGAGEWAAFAPSFRRGPAMRAAADVLSHLGPLHTVTAEFVSGRGEGSLGARLFDAFETVTSLLGDAESVDAMYVWPGRGKIVHPTVGESLRGLSGIMTANLRFPDGRAATVLAGDHSVGCGRWSRRITVIGEGGRLVVRDDRFEIFSADGKSYDRSAPVLAGADGQSLVGAVLADQIRRTLELAPPAVPPTDYARVLSTTGAAVLSARTGEAESPETILRMARTG